MKMNQNGVTLIEVMIAITIFAVGLLSIASMQITSIRANTSSLQRTEAASLAQSTIEELLTRSLADPVFLGAPTVELDANVLAASGGSYTVTATVSPGLPTADLARLDVQVQNNVNNNINVTIGGFKRLK